MQHHTVTNPPRKLEQKKDSWRPLITEYGGYLTSQITAGDVGSL